jgi:hypothetical protein
VRQDFEFQGWLLRLGVRYLTGGSDVGYILSAGRADVKQLRKLKLWRMRLTFIHEGIPLALAGAVFAQGGPT